MNTVFKRQRDRRYQIPKQQFYKFVILGTAFFIERIHNLPIKKKTFALCKTERNLKAVVSF